MKINLSRRLIMKINLNHIARDACKVERVIDSCQTYDQAIMAHNMKCHFYKTYSECKDIFNLHDKVLKCMQKFASKPPAYEN